MVIWAAEGLTNEPVPAGERPGRGKTTDLTEGAGGPTAGYEDDVFGAIRSQSGSSPSYWLYTGEQRDSDSELYYLRARYYDPATRS